MIFTVKTHPDREVSIRPMMTDSRMEYRADILSEDTEDGYTLDVPDHLANLYEHNIQNDSATISYAKSSEPALV